MEERPKLTDPAEFALIREMYFEDATTRNIDIDPIEQWEREQMRNTQNQAR